MGSPTGGPRWHRAAIWGGIVLVLSGVFLPERGYDPLPPRADQVSSSVSGWPLLQALLVIEGIGLIWMGWRRYGYQRLKAGNRLIFLSASGTERDPRHPLFWLTGISLVGLALRLVSLNSDLWLDEITPRFNYRYASTWRIVTSYIASNNHLLNTILVNFSTALFGEREWAIRLPAMAFGTASLPVMYWVARQVLSIRASLGAAALLAVSYHHVFFSQNARGYTAYLFFALVSSTLFVIGLQRDRPRTWAAYLVTMTLGFAAIAITSFVFAAHLLVGALAVSVIQYRGDPAGPMFRRLAGVLTIASLLALQIYVVVLPQMLTYVQTVYRDPATGFAALSREFATEVWRGLSTGFASWLALGAIPFVAIAGVGYGSLFKRNWALIVALTAPLVIHVGFVVAFNLTVYPRFFILALPLTILVTVSGLEVVSAWVGRVSSKPSATARVAFVAIVIVLIVGSLASLRTYYEVPKQAYRASLQYLESNRDPQDIVIVMHFAASGYLYYGERFGIKEGTDYFFLRSVEALDKVLAEHPNDRSWAVVTFPRSFRLDVPDLYERLIEGWVLVREFPGTIGDGAITVWRQRSATRGASTLDLDKVRVPGLAHRFLG